MTNMRELTPELAKQAEAELNETSSRTAKDLKTLREWILKQPHLTSRLDDQFLIAFLRGCKFSLERAKEKIDMFYTIRGAIPEFFAHRDPSRKELARVIEEGLCLPLPHVDKRNNSRLLLIRQGAYDPNEISVMDVMKVSYMLSDLMLLEDDYTTVGGQTILIDLKGLSFGHVKQQSPTLLKKMTTSIQDAYPIRQKGMHFINPSSGFDTLFKIFYGFMSEKIKKRIFVHSTLDDLHKHVPKNLLPSEYDGDIGPLANIADDWRIKLSNKRDWYLDDQKYISNEKKRIGKSKNADLLFGIDGSFRSLEID